MIEHRTQPQFARRDPLPDLSSDVSELGREIVEVGGVLDTVSAQVDEQVAAFEQVTRSVDALSAANASVSAAIGSVVARVNTSMSDVTVTVNGVQSSSKRTEEVATWVRGLAERMTDIDQTLTSMRKQNSAIADIARQVNILAINAKIEAARAGDAGRGFAVVADAVNELSRKTGEAAAGISASILDLNTRVTELVSESSGIGAEAGAVIDDIATTNTALNSLSASITQTKSDAAQITSSSNSVRDAVDMFTPAFANLSSGFNLTAEEIRAAKSNSDSLVERSERIVQATFSMGGTSEDHTFIDRVTEDASRIGAVLEAAVARGDISMQALFSTRYEPIPGTDPQQVVAPVLNVSDKLFPDVQEAALESDPKVIFCAAVDRNGYLPTHNQKFSKPQGPDPAWNAGNCRNRRIFDDRVGLKAGRNKESFLLQVYRRDMGGGTFRTMKDLSAPIFVNGRHWGGLRLAYSFL